MAIPLFIFIIIDRTNDKLNGAVSGSIAKNLDNQLDYIIPSMFYLLIRTTYHCSIIIMIFISIEIKDMASDFDNDWKLINIQIGSKL